MTGFYLFARELTRWVRVPLIWTRFTGTGNIPASGGYVIACNHRSLVDPVILAHGISRQIYYMGKAELFKIPVLGSILRWLHVFPVERGTGDTSAVQHAIDLLRGGGMLGIFPEGTRSKDGHPLRFKSGMAHIAKSAQVGVLPCAICFKGRFRVFKRIEVKFGEPIPYDELFGEEESGAALKRATKLVQARIVEMLDLEEKSS